MKVFKLNNKITYLNKVKVVGICRVRKPSLILTRLANVNIKKSFFLLYFSLKFLEFFKRKIREKTHKSTLVNYQQVKLSRTIESGAQTVGQPTSQRADPSRVCCLNRRSNPGWSADPPKGNDVVSFWAIKGPFFFFFFSFFFFFFLSLSTRELLSLALKLQ